MSIKDYSKNYVVINGTTNERHVIPKADVNTIVLKDTYINDLMLFEYVLAELHESDSVTIVKTYMKE